MGIFKTAAMVMGGIAVTKVWSDMVNGVRKDYKEFNENHDAYKKHVLDIYKDDHDIRATFDGRTPITTEKWLLFLRYMIEKSVDKTSPISKDDHEDTMKETNEEVKEDVKEMADEESASCSDQRASCATLEFGNPSDYESANK